MQTTPRQLLKKYWGYDEFRPLQQDIVDAVLNERDTLALMPTGGGKSICFQVPAMMEEGICIVITPLIALMQDQVAQLTRRGIPAIALHSGLSWKELDTMLDNCAYGKVKFLYLSPERLQTELFKARIAKMPVNLIAVDEAHCISAWGHDFRPSYRMLLGLRAEKPQATWIALTATATKEVQQDIVVQLGLKNPAVFQKSFARDNLSFVVRCAEHSDRQLLFLLQRVPGSAIVYTRSRKNTTLLATLLRREGVPATFYHAGLSQETREAHQRAWIEGETRVMVATNAFGMGIDKADVRIVVHVDMPDTLEAYYQEAGRAGRDGKRAYAVMVYHESGFDALRERTRQAHPTVVELKNIYQALANYYGLAIGSAQGESFDLDLEHFCRRYRKRISQVRHGLKRLQECGAIAFDEATTTPSSIHLHAGREDLYTAQVAHTQYDRLIKTLLHVYGSELFSRPVTISEQRLARTMGESIGETKKMLVHLHNRQLLCYKAASDLPRVTFVTARQEAQKLHLDIPQLNTSRKRAIAKQEAVITYVSRRGCRMQAIQLYFGETGANTCGLCDVCLANKPHDRVQGERNYRQQVKELLTRQPMTLDQLERTIDPFRQDDFVRAVRTLLDSAEIKYDARGLLTRIS